MISPQKYFQSCLLLLPHLLCSGYTGLVPIPQIYQMWPSKSLYLGVPFFPVDILMVHSLAAFRYPLICAFSQGLPRYLSQVAGSLSLQTLLSSYFTKLFPYSIQYCLILYYYKFFCPSEFLPQTFYEQYITLYLVLF